MWYTVNASGDEFVRMRIRCSQHPVRACDVLSMHKPRRFFCSNQRTSNLKFVTGIYFQTFTVRLSPCDLTHIIPLNDLKNTFYLSSYPWQYQKSFVIETSVAHFLSSEKFLYCSSEKAHIIKLVGFGRIFSKAFATQ